MANVRKRLLCIEDEPEIASLLAEELTARGFEVFVADNGQEGISAILNWTPDLIICDINMPVMSGFQVLERLTALGPRFGDMPFIFLTGRGGRHDELMGRQLGADDYVTKPIDFDILMTIISARLARVARSEIWPKKVTLTERESQALTWAARGKTSAEIAYILGLSKRTIDFYMETAKTKLGASSRAEAVTKALSGRLIAP
jgi:DNA-binding response OmpR family regulator